MQISLRDPGGQTCLVDNRVLRIVNKEGLGDLAAFLRSSSSLRFAKSDQLVNTSFLSAIATEEILKHEKVRLIYASLDGASIVEHERVPFPSFPYEWPPEMLHAAATLTLDFAETLTDEGLGLKDASPYNVLFRGSKPVFVDLLSFERRDPKDPTWLPLAQFVRTFLVPLLINKHFGISLAQLLTNHRDGVEPEEAFRLLSPTQRLRSPFLTLVSIPVWLTPRRPRDVQRIYRKRVLNDAAKARFVLRRVLKNAKGNLANVAPSVGRRSNWSNYAKENSYSLSSFARKQEFVRAVMVDHCPQTVLDAGCNTGQFSIIAARSGASVVAIDRDSVVVGEVWRRADSEGLDILPLVVNLARPSPSIGWCNRECPSFLDRARGYFDAVLMLGVLHHLIVSEQIPLPQIIELAAELTNDLLVIEFVAPDDPMFRQIARGRDQLFTTLTKKFFEETCRKHFEPVRCERLDQSSRWLYLMRRKEALIECFETQH